VDPFAERDQLHLRPLPPTADELVRQHHAPPRLITHLILVHDVANQLIEAFQTRDIAEAIDTQAVLFGAAIHDIGKVLHPRELIKPGHQHEHAGKELLLQAGVTPELARFAETHGQPTATSNAIEDLLVALADTCWKGERDHALEQRIVIEQASHGDQESWAALLTIDDVVEHIASNAEQRLLWQSQFSADF